MSKSAKPMYTAKVEVWAPKLDRGPLVEEYFIETTPGAVGRRQRLGNALDGTRGHTGAAARLKTYCGPSGLVHQGATVEIKDREPRSNHPARKWEA